MDKLAQLFSDLLPMVFELTRESITVPDKDFQEITETMLENCRERPAAYWLAQKIVHIVTDKRAEIRARNAQNSPEE